MHIVTVYGNTVRCFCLFCTAVERDGHSDAAGSRCVAAEGFCSRQEMAPKKRKKPAAGDGATPERSAKRKKRAEPPPPNTTFRSRRITWRYLESGDPIGPTRVMDSRFEDDDQQEDDCPHTAHMEFFTHTRATTTLEHVQEGAALAEHVDDLVSINDTFVAQVKQGCENVQDAVVISSQGGGGWCSTVRGLAERRASYHAPGSTRAWGWPWQVERQQR